MEAGSRKGVGGGRVGIEAKFHNEQCDDFRCIEVSLVASFLPVGVPRSR